MKLRIQSVWGPLIAARLILPAIPGAEGAPLPPEVRRVIFLGDSITYSGQYVADLEYEGYNEVLDRYSEWLMGQRINGWEVIDVHGPMNDYLKNRRLTQPNFTFAGDGVHLDDEGHWLVARQVLGYFDAPRDLREADGVDVLLARIPNGAAVLNVLRERQRILTDTWLTRIGHQRPGMHRGLAPSEAELRAAELNEEISRRLQCAPAALRPFPPEGN